MTKDEALKLALEALELSAVTVDSFGVQKKTNEAITAIKEALAEQPAQLTGLQKDAANLLFALHDAWPYVHQWCTIESKKNRIVALVRKHGDFADTFPQPAQPQQEPVAGKGKELSEQLKLCAWNVAFVAAGRVDMSSAAMQEMFALIDHVCVGLDSPPHQRSSVAATSARG